MSAAGLYGGSGRGYGTDVGQSAITATTGGLHGFPAALTSYVGTGAELPSCVNCLVSA